MIMVILLELLRIRLKTKAVIRLNHPLECPRRVGKYIRGSFAYRQVWGNTRMIQVFFFAGSARMPEREETAVRVCGSFRVILSDQQEHSAET